MVLLHFHHSLKQNSLHLLGLWLAMLTWQQVVLGMEKGPCCLLETLLYKHMAYREERESEVMYTVPLITENTRLPTKTDRITDNLNFYLVYALPSLRRKKQITGDMHLYILQYNTLLLFLQKHDATEKHIFLSCCMYIMLCLQSNIISILVSQI